MTPPTIKELCEKATPGPWSIGAYLASTIFANVPGVPGGPVMIAETTNSNEAANAQLIARCSPSVMLAVVEALDMTEALLKAISAHHETLPRDLVIACKIRTQMVTEALNALNGKAP